MAPNYQRLELDTRTHETSEKKAGNSNYEADVHSGHVSREQNLVNLYTESGKTLEGSFSAVSESESESEVVWFSKRKKT